LFKLQEHFYFNLVDSRDCEQTKFHFKKTAFDWPAMEADNKKAQFVCARRKLIEKKGRPFVGAACVSLH
jgi:hypothetical protein